MLIFVNITGKGIKIGFWNKVKYLTYISHSSVKIHNVKTSPIPSEPILKAHITDKRLNRETWTFCWTQRKLTPGRIRSDSARCALDDGRFGRENSALLKLHELRNELVSQKMAPYLFCYSNVPPGAVGFSWISRLCIRCIICVMFAFCAFRTCQPNVFPDSVIAMHVYWKKKMYRRWHLQTFTKLSILPL